MIKINLKNRKAAVGVTSGSATGGGVGSQLSDILAKLKGGGGVSLEAMTPELRSQLILASVYLVVLGAAWWYGDGERTRLLNEVNSEISNVDSRITLLASELNKTNGYEQTKKGLETDEKTIRTKIETIQELIRDRGTPPKILMTLSEATPKDVWLRDFALRDRKFKITGSSFGMDVVSDFIKSLEETVYFKNVTLKSSRTEPGQKAGRDRALFDLEGERR